LACYIPRWYTRPKTGGYTIKVFEKGVFWGTNVLLDSAQAWFYTGAVRLINDSGTKLFAVHRSLSIRACRRKAGLAGRRVLSNATLLYITQAFNAALPWCFDAPTFDILGSVHTRGRGSISSTTAFLISISILYFTRCLHFTVAVVQPVVQACVTYKKVALDNTRRPARPALRRQARMESDRCTANSFVPESLISRTATVCYAG